MQKLSKLGCASCGGFFDVPKLESQLSALEERMSAADFFYAVRRLASDPRVRIIDLTEWDPPLDPGDLSALAAARWVAECLAGYEMR